MLYGILEEKLYKRISEAGGIVFGKDKDSVISIIKREERHVADIIMEYVLQYNKAASREKSPHEQRDIRVKRAAQYEDIDLHTNVLIVESFSLLELFREPKTLLRYELKSFHPGKRLSTTFYVDAYGAYMADSPESRIFNSVEEALLKFGYVKGERHGSYWKSLQKIR